MPEVPPVKRDMTVDLRVPVRYVGAYDAGWTASTDVNGCTRLIGKGATRGGALKDLEGKLADYLGKLFW